MELIRIEHIDDVVPHIPRDREIIVSSRPDHTVIDYVYTMDDTIDTAIARECRGLKFDTAGRIIARLRGATFSALDGKDTRTAVTQILVGASHSDARVDAVRDLFRMAWRTDDLALPELEG